MKVLKEFDMKVKTDYTLGDNDDSMHVSLTVNRDMNGNLPLDSDDIEDSHSGGVYTFQHNVFHEDTAGKTVNVRFDLVLYHKDSDDACIIGTVVRGIFVVAK